MTPPFRTGRKGLDPQAFFFAVFVIALTVAAISLLLQPGNQVEGRPLPQDNGLPEVSLKPQSHTTPEVKEGETLRIKVEVQGSLTAHECRDGYDKCIEGGILVYDSYNDSAEGRFADSLIAFLIHQDKQDSELSYSVCDDGIEDDDRKIEVSINSAFDAPTYHYTIKGIQYDQYYNEIGGESETLKFDVVEGEGDIDRCPFVRVSPTKLALAQEGMGSYDVILNSRPRQTVRITITLEPNTLVTVMPESLTFDPETWATKQPVNVMAGTEDGVVTISHNVESQDYEYRSLSVENVLVTVGKANTPATGLPSISGSLRVGQRLTVNTNGIRDADGLTHPDYTYQWQRNGEDIQNTNSRTYTLSDNDEGATIKVKVTFRDDSGNEEMLESLPLGPVSPRPPPNTANFTPTPTNTPTPTQSNSGGGGGGGGGGNRPIIVPRPPPPPPPPPPEPENEDKGTSGNGSGGGESGSSGGGGSGGGDGRSASDLARSASFSRFQQSLAGLLVVVPFVTPTPTPTLTPTATPLPTLTPTPEATATPMPTVTATPTSTPTPTATPVPALPPTPIPPPTFTPQPVGTPTPTPVRRVIPAAVPPSLEEPGLPVIGKVAPRVRSALGQAFGEDRTRMTLVIILIIVLVGAAIVFIYLIFRRR